MMAQGDPAGQRFCHLCPPVWTPLPRAEGMLSNKKKSDYVARSEHPPPPFARLCIIYTALCSYTSHHLHHGIFLLLYLSALPCALSHISPVARPVGTCPAQPRNHRTASLALASQAHSGQKHREVRRMACLISLPWGRGITYSPSRRRKDPTLLCHQASFSDSTRNVLAASAGVASCRSRRRRRRRQPAPTWQTP